MPSGDLEQFGFFFPSKLIWIRGKGPKYQVNNTLKCKSRCSLLEKYTERVHKY